MSRPSNVVKKSIGRPCFAFEQSLAVSIVILLDLILIHSLSSRLFTALDGAGAATPSQTSAIVTDMAFNPDRPTSARPTCTFLDASFISWTDFCTTRNITLS
jgi:hypothetical protein